MRSAPHLAVSSEHEPCARIAIRDAREGLEQQQLALLRTQPSDTDEDPLRPGFDRRRLEEGFVDRAAHDVELPPVVEVDPAAQLGAGIRADRDRKARVGDLARELETARIVELVGPVHRHAEARPAEALHDLRDADAVAREMDMDVFDRIGPEALEERGGFDEIGESLDEPGPGPKERTHDPPELAAIATGCIEAVRRKASATEVRGKSKNVSVRSRSDRSAGSAIPESAGRTESRRISWPRASSPWISRRMKVWLTFGYCPVR